MSLREIFLATRDILNSIFNHCFYWISDKILYDSKDLKVAIITPLQQQNGQQVVQNGKSYTDKTNCLEKASSWSWKDKLKLSRRIWSASNLESAMDISQNNEKQGYTR